MFVKLKPTTSHRKCRRLSDSFLQVMVLFWSITRVSVFICSFQYVLNHHSTVFCFCLAGAVVKKSFYRGQNSISKLLGTLRKWFVWCLSQKQKFRWLKISKSERERILNVHFAECCICGKEAQVSTRVIHHNHLSGKVFGVAPSKCKLQARTTNFLSVFFHNFSRHDSHHLPKTLKLEKGEKLSAIAKTD